MDDKFARLEELSTRLNESSDSLTEAITRIEQKFASLRLGVSVSLQEPLEVSTIIDAMSREGEIRSFLAYKKTKSGWRLVITQVPDPTLDLDFSGDHMELDLEDIPLQEASRDLRIKAMLQVPALLEELKARAEQAIREVDKALRIAKTV